MSAGVHTLPLPSGADPVRLVAQAVGLRADDGARVGRVFLPRTWPEGSSLQVRVERSGAGSGEVLDPSGRTIGWIDAVRRARQPVELPAGAVAFVCAGQGTQRVGMGRALIARDPVARAALLRVLDTLDHGLCPSLREVMLGDDPEVAAQVHDTAWTQPALFALQVTLAERWATRGVRPGVLLGHSVGGVAAAYLAGVLDLPGACTLIRARGAVMATLAAPGAMAAIAASEREVRRAIEDEGGHGVEIAAVNAEDQVVVTGDEAAVDEVVRRFLALGQRARRLAVRTAFHSRAIEAALPAFATAIAAVPMKPPRIPLISEITGTLVGAEIADPAYWLRQARATVRFADALAELGAMAPAHVVELGPGAELCGLAARAGVRALPSLSADDEPGTFGRAAAAVGGQGPSTVAGADSVDHPWLTLRVGQPGDQSLWFGAIDPGRHPWLRDHRVGGQVIVPATAWLELSLAVGAAHGLGVGHLRFLTPCPLGEAPLAVQVQVGAAQQGARTLEIAAQGPDGAWHPHASGQLAVVPPPVGAAPPTPSGDTEALYAELAAAGLDYGPGFRTATARANTGEGCVAAARVAEDGGFVLHPALADGLLHGLVAGVERLVVPFELGDVAVDGRAGARLHVAWRSRGEDAPSGVAFDPQGRARVTWGRVVMRPMGSPAPRPLLHAVTWRSAPTTATARGRWRVVGEGPAAARVAAALTAAGASVETATELVSPDPGLAGWVWVPEVPAGEPATAARSAVRAASRAVTALGGTWAPASQRRVVVVAGALSAVGGAVHAGSESLAALVGWLRVARHELGAGMPAIVELQDGGDAALAAALAADDEPEGRVGSGGREVPRLVSVERQGRPEVPPLVWITGGTGGLGAALATELVERHGARRLVLSSRRGPDAPGVGPLVARLMARGAQVEVVAADVTDRAAVQRLADRLGGDLREAWVIHAAGVLEDRAIGSLDEAAVEAVLRPKIDAALHLAAAAPEASLILCGSISAHLAPPGQAAYAAANAWLAAHAAGSGGRVRCLGWGAWAEAGMFARLGEAAQGRLLQQGIVPFASVDGATALLDALGTELPAPVLAAWSPRALAERPGGPPPLFAELAPAPTTAASTSPASGDLLALTRAVIARGLGLSGPEAVDPDEPLHQLGLDSLLAVELRERLAAATGLTLPATLLFDHPTARAAAVTLAARLAPRPAVPEAAAAGPHPEATATNLDALDDDALLAHAVALLGQEA